MVGRVAARAAVALAVLLAGGPPARAATQSAPFAAVVPGRAVDPRADAGSHPAYRTEWWYLTGWLTEAGSGRDTGFQLTFFRSRTAAGDDNPSRFAARQLIIAHAALVAPGAAPWHAQRIARAGFGLAGAAEDHLEVALDDWYLEARGGQGLALRALEAGTGLSLTLTPTGPALVHGDRGFSRKSAAPGAASEYYSLPQLAVGGEILRAGQRIAVTGRAWFDHEWSSALLDPAAQGWDWIGLNLDDGGAVMAFRIRDRTGRALYAGGTWRTAAGATTVLAPDEVGFVPGRRWRSPHTGTEYPVEWTVRVGAHRLVLEPLVDDQEADTRATTGAVYWEGAVRASEAGGALGRGYLELTGYDQPFVLP